MLHNASHGTVAPMTETWWLLMSEMLGWFSTGHHQNVTEALQTLQPVGWPVTMFTASYWQSCSGHQHHRCHEIVQVLGPTDTVQSCPAAWLSDDWPLDTPCESFAVAKSVSVA